MNGRPGRGIGFLLPCITLEVIPNTGGATDVSTE